MIVQSNLRIKLNFVEEKMVLWKIHGCKGHIDKVYPTIDLDIIVFL
jgi:hypothetical protein